MVENKSSMNNDTIRYPAPKYYYVGDRNPVSNTSFPIRNDFSSFCSYKQLKRNIHQKLD